MMRRRTILILLFLAASSISWTVASGARSSATPSEGKPAAKAPREEPVARWKGGSVTASELKEQAINRVGMAIRHGNEVSGDGMRIILLELIGQRMLQQEALTEEILSDPRFTGSYALASAQAVAERYLKEVLRERLAPSDEDVKPLLPERRTVVRVKQIVVSTAEEAEEVLKRIQGGMPFDEAVDKHSIVKVDPGATMEVRDSDDHIDTEARRRILDLSPGEMSGILPMKIGYGIVLALESRRMDDAEWKSAAESIKRTLLEKRIGEHYQALTSKINVAVDAQELMLAARDDFDFRLSRRPVLTVGGEPVYFDDYARTRDRHLRDTMRIRTAQELYTAYKVQLENVGVAVVLAKAAAAEKGWTEPGAEQKGRIRATIALRVLGERLFEGIAVKEEDVEKEYRNNKKAFTIKKRLQVRRLTFPSREEASRFVREVKTRDRFYDELRKRATKKDNHFNSFYEWQDYDKLDEITKKAFRKAKKGKLTDVASIGDKEHHVYFVEDLQKNHLVPYADVRVNIKRTLLRQKQQEKLSAFVEGRKRKLDVRIDEAQLGRVLADLNKGVKSHSPGHGRGSGGS